jgi:photosystem II stability/assembly factor-like uncharacterized protein
MRMVLLWLTLLAVLAAASAPASPADDGGWTKVYDHPAGAAKSIEMFDDDFGLAVIGNGIERTTDGGLTWTATDSTAVAGGKIAFADREHAWIAGGSTLLHTDDGGSTWQRQRVGTSAARFTGISAVSADEAWATSYDTAYQGYPPHGASALLHTVDAGERWQPVVVPGYGIFLGVWFVGADGWVLATQCHPGDESDPDSKDPPPCIDHQTLLHTPDGGHSWSALPHPEVVLGGEIARVDKQLAYRAGGCEVPCGGGALYRTADGGRTWESALSDYGPNDGIIGLRFTSPLDGWLSVWQIKPESRNAEFRTRLAHTRDGGEHWTFVDSPDLARGAFDVTSSYAIASGGAGAVLLYDVEHGTWRSASTHARPALRGIRFVTRDRGYAGVQGGGPALLTNDGGASWEPWVTQEHLRITITTQDALWATGDAPFYRSGDLGVSWREVPPPPGADRKQRLEVIGSAGDSVWVVAGVWLWRSDDLGTTWSQLELSPRLDYRVIDRDHGWSVQCGIDRCRNSVRITADRGDTWETSALPAGTTVGAFFNALDGWGSGPGCSCMITTHDGGHTWQTSALPAGTALSTMFTPLDGRGSGDKCGCAIVTHDGGQSWETRPRATLPSIAAVQFIDTDHGFAAVYDLKTPGPLQVLSTQDGGVTWTKALEGPAAFSIPTIVTADGRAWVTFTSNDAADDLIGPTNHVTIYRYDFAPPPAATPVAGAAGTTGHRKPLLAALVAGVALAGTLAAAGSALRLSSWRSWRRRPSR